MLELAFADGLKIGMKIFKIVFCDVRIENVNRQLSALETKLNSELNVLNYEMRKFKKELNDVSRFRKGLIEAQVRDMLSLNRKANSDNVNAVVSFVMSIGHYIKAVSISGAIGQQCHNGPTEDMLLLSTFLSEKEILESITKFASFTSITDVRIDTRPIRSRDDMKDIGKVIASFYKVLDIFNKPLLPLSDQFPTNGESIVHIHFSGMYDLNYIISNPLSSDINVQSYHAVHRNVYIFGQNGAGKSTWGNIIVGGQANTFKTGDSIHTTMMPQHFDVDYDKGFRLWDLPGLYDGTSYATCMEDHITSTVNYNHRYSSVVFVFDGSHRPNEIVNDILDYAIRLFGPSVRKRFIAIVNSFDRRAILISQLYAAVLSRYKFKVTEKSFYVLGTNEPFQKYDTVRNAIDQYQAHLVWKHQNFFNQVLRMHNDNIDAVLKKLHNNSKAELLKFIGQNRISTFINEESRWFFGNNGTEPESITIRKHSVGFFGRKKNDETEDRIVIFDRSARKSKVSTMALQRTWYFEQMHIFLGGILEDPDNVLMLSTDPKFDYVLFHLKGLNHTEKKEKIYSQLRDLSNDYDSDSDGDVSSVRGHSSVVGLSLDLDR